METVTEVGRLGNTMQWDGQLCPHFEVWHVTLNQLNSGAGFRIRHAIIAPRKGTASAQVSFTSFVPSVAQANVAAAKLFPIDLLSFTKNPFSLRIGPASLAPERLAGKLDAADAAVSWDLSCEPVTEPLELLPEVLYRAFWIRAKLVTPYPFMHVGGEIRIRDSRFLLNGDPGQLVHAWGTRHPDEWIWFHCSSFLSDSGDLVPGYVTGVAAQRRPLGRLNLPPLSYGHLVWKERHLPIRPVSSWPSRWRGPWEWQGRLADEVIAVTLTVPWHDMVVAEYDDPAGRRSYCQYADRADCVLTFRSPRLPARVFRATGLAHLEIGSRDTDPRVTRRIQRSRFPAVL
jgi:hypothetical protein